MTMTYRDRIKELRRVPAKDIRGAPFNWRVHPASQVEALLGSIEELGFFDPLDTRELPDGSLEMFDGHARQDLINARIGPNTLIPCIVTDFTEAEAKKANLLKDPLAGMAEADPVKVDALIAEVTAESEALAKLIDDLKAEGVGETVGPGEDETDKLESVYAVMIRCSGETDQKAMLTELARHPIDVRALVVDVMKQEPIAEQPPVDLGKGEVEIKRSVKVKRTPRVMQLEGMFDAPPAKKLDQTWRFKMELDRPWNIGLIVGPSGSGKSTVARELFADHLVAAWPWSEDKSIIDDFPADLPIAEIVGLLSSVGFSSPPSWVKPFRVLSNGEQFRVNLARTLAEKPGLAVIDEFTSVVDRTVAQIGSAALAKAVRAGGRRLIAASCHYDIEQWLQPDWKLEMPSGELTWGLLRRRPILSLRVRRVGKEWWSVFGRHHYLADTLHPGSTCFLGEIDGRPAAFTAVIHQPGIKYHSFREHRTVCLPDFQGVGIGNGMSELVAGMYLAAGHRYRSITSHPAMIAHRLRSRNWRCVRAPLLSVLGGKISKTAKYKRTLAKKAGLRLTACFEFIGPGRPVEAESLGVY